MIVGCYTLDLYCDNGRAGCPDRAEQHQFTAKRLAQCMRQARKEGWKIALGMAYCPKCARSKKGKNKHEGH